MSMSASSNAVVQKMTEKLYRFQPVCIPGDDRLSGLKNGEIWFSDPAKFNDPFDLRPNIKNLLPDRWCNEPEFNAAMRKALGYMMKNPAMYQGALFLDPALVAEFQAWAGDDFEDESGWDIRLRTAVQARISHFGVVCLTPQWDNRLMWAHYANSGHGFCIEYEVDLCQQQPDFRYVPVLYSSQTPELCITEAMFTPHQFLYRVLATKHADWAYEQEVRLVCLTDKGKHVKVEPKFVRMTGLVAGYAMPEPLQSHLKQTAERLNVNAMRMTTRHQGCFDMVPAI
jgi:hypothetical protein